MTNPATQSIISNQTMRLVINHHGAEMISLSRYDNEFEYLWQPHDSRYWSRTAPVLFPIVGKLAENRYTLGSDTYSMSQHGFGRDRLFEIIDQKPGFIEFGLQADLISKAIYPFDFELRISYQLIDYGVIVAYKITNPADTNLYFSIGAHPGFSLLEGSTFADYSLDFEHPENATQYTLDNGLIAGKAAVSKLNNVGFISFNSKSFDQDALVFEGIKSDWVRMKHNELDHQIFMSLNGFDYLGVWSKPDASFVCLEPWCGLADFAGQPTDFTRKIGIQTLGAGQVFERSFSIKTQ